MDQTIQRKKTRWGKAEIQNEKLTKENIFLDNTRSGIHTADALASSTTTTTTTGGLNNNFNFLPLNLNFQLDIQRAREVARLALEKAKKAKEANEKLNEKKNDSIHKGSLYPKPIRFDAHGKAIDEKGNVVDIKPTPHISLKINKLEGSNVKNKELEVAETKEHQEQEKFNWIDPRIRNKKKKKHALNFIRPGSLIEQESYANANTSIETFQCDYDFKKMTLLKKTKTSLKGAGKNNIKEQTVTNMIMDKNTNVSLVSETVKPEKCWEEDERYDSMEAWDTVLFTKMKNKDHTYISEKVQLAKEHLQKENSDTRENSFNKFYFKIRKILCEQQLYLLENNEIVINNELYKIHMKKITKYVEHPVPLHNVKKKKKPPTYMYLTPAERKKLRKRKRQEKEKEKQDKIRIGLIPPPPSKMKLSNLIKVLGTAASALPSKIEMEVREQIKEREMRHYEQNQKRKLKPEEKTQKKINKWKCDPNAENEVAVIAIRNLSNKKNVFKIDINAQQLHLTGVCFISGICNFIIIEGKHVSVERYKRLIFRRIKWGNEDEGDEESDVESRNGNKEEYNYQSKKTLENSNEYNNVTWSSNVRKIRNCELIWNGSVKKKIFYNWKILYVKKEAEITNYLLEHDALHYYHVVRKYKEVQEGI